MSYIGKKPSDITRAIANYDTFTGDGSTTTFTLTQGAASANDLTVVVNNVRQEPGSGKAYTATSQTLTMRVAPTAGDEMYCIFQGKAVGLITPPDNTISGAKINSTFDISSKTVTLPATSVTSHLTYTHGTATGDASTVAFTITAGRAVADVLVHVNGILMTPTTDYSISSTTLTFVTAPAASAEIDFRYLPK